MMRRFLYTICLLLGLEQVVSAQMQREFLNVRYGERRAELTEADTNQDRLLDIYLPNAEKPVQGYPVIMFIHGGGFRDGGKGMRGGVHGIFQGFLDEGYAVVSINYRLLRNRDRQGDSGRGRGHRAPRGPRHTPDRNDSTGRSFSPEINAATDEAAADATLALKWLNSNGSSYGLDLSRLFLAGGSAGSITALYTAFVTAPKEPKIQAVINFWGGIRDTSLIQNPAIPVLTIHGDRDMTVNVNYGLNIQQRLEHLDSKLSRIIVLEGRGHAQYQYVGDFLMPEIFSFLHNIDN